MLLGVTHQCQYPKDAKFKPKIIDTVIDSKNLNSHQIDEITCKMFKDGKDIFVLNKKNIKKANPNLIISQNTCSVCAAHTSQVQQAIKILDVKPEIYSMDPHNVKEILEGIIEISEILKIKERGTVLKKELECRIKNVKKVKIQNRPKIVAIEWIEPLFTAGHWIPEMIEIAGGTNLISSAKEHSQMISIQDILQANPEIIVLMPCGFDVKKTKSEYERFLKNDIRWNRLEAVKNGKVFATDANSFFSKPSIRTIQGIEILAKIIHPKEFAVTSVPKNSYTKLG